MALVAGLWSNTAAISSVKFTSDTLFVQHSTATLYGIGGGTITADGEYTYHTFTSSGTFTALENIKNAEILVVAGGGGGGDNIGGGGGASAFSQSGFNITPSTVSVIVGAGGTAGNNGNISSAFSYTATGGAFGLHQNITYTNGGNGGAGVYTLSRQTTSYTGGTSRQFDGNAIRLGGGGAGTASNGGNAVFGSNTGGNGGNGLLSFNSWLSATNTGQLSNGLYYIGGGGAGGGEQNSYTRGTPGLGGGGIAGLGTAQVTGGSGVANTGGGGGGAGGTANVASGNGGSGGSGLVIIRYPNT